MVDARLFELDSRLRRALPPVSGKMSLLVSGPSALHASFSIQVIIRQGAGKRTMVRYRVDPLVQRGVELRDDVLLPLRPDEA